MTNSRTHHLMITGAVNNASNIVCNTDYYTDAQMCKLMSDRQNDEISVLYMNIRSIVCNFDEFTNYIAQFEVKPDIIALSETKITHKVNENPHVDIAGYKFIYSKSSTFFGGVGLYISVKLEYEIREDLDITEKQECHCETLFIELTSRKKKKHVIGIVYRHPKSQINPNYRKFTSEYEKVLLKLTNEKSNFYITGDFNIDVLLSSKNNNVKKFVDMAYSSGACMPIDRATRVPLHTERCCGNRRNNKKKKKCNLGKASLLDHVYLNDVNAVKHIGINVKDITDHYPIFFVIKTDTTRMKREGIIYKRNYRNFDEKTFNNEILDHFENNAQWQRSINEQFELLHESILKALDQTAPLRELTKKEKRMEYKPWFNRDFKKRISERDHLYFLIQKRDKKELIPEYETSKRNLKRDIEKAERDYFNELFEKHKKDSKECWKLINTVINKRKNKAVIIKKIRTKGGGCTYDQKQICDIMNNHFVNNGPNLAKKIPSTNVTAKSFLEDPVSQSFVMKPTNQKEIEGLIDKLKTGTACGPYKIAPRTIKNGKCAISFILARLINQSIISGIYPACLKRALVVPLHKKESKELPDNYRPISLVPCIAMS